MQTLRAQEVLQIGPCPIRGAAALIKRALDIAFTLASAPVAVPAVLILALLVRLDSPGPIIFTQRRVGQSGRIFRIYKFRTMVADADQYEADLQNQHGEPLLHKRKDDPRVTRLGRFLRSTSLDELPQLLNVLKGEMSLVGPRPELPWIVEKYEPWQYARLAVPQGLTGWWQVNGRSDRPMQLHTRDDLYYIDHFSVWLDLKILWKTIWVVVRRAGAF